MSDNGHKYESVPEEPVLFSVDPDWRKEWDGMPEFVQPKQKEYAKLVVRFRNEGDLKKFSELIEQKLNQKTKSIWFPFASHWGMKLKRWVDES